MGLVPDVPARPQARPDGVDTQPEPEILAEAPSDEVRPSRPELRPGELGDTVPDETLANATERGVLPPGETTLIGLFNGPEGGSALVRLPGGAVVRVAPGTQVAGGRVTAIDEDGLHLLRGGETIRLTMPG
jgi:hypothetical protein